MIVIGLGIVLVNFAEYGDIGVLPGGHSELYFLSGLALAGTSLWWFGAFDAPL